MVGKMPAELDNEVALVRLAQAGSNESLGILVNHYEREIYHLARTPTKNAEDAADVLQEAFLKGYANIHRFKGESRFCTWLAGIAMNEMVAKLQLRQVHGWIPFDEAPVTGEAMSSPGETKGWHHSPEETYSKPELFVLLSKALEDLETPFRTVFALRDIEGFSDEETASVLGLPVAAVTARLTHARLKLRQDLSIWFENPSVTAAGWGGCESVRYSLGAALAEDRDCT
jgi:RNA polymerase sigma-70 factor, ECF subfamily